MIRNLKLLSHLVYGLRRQFSSALYITDDKANKTFAVLTPVIDIEKRLSDKDALEKNLKARQLPLEVERVKEQWESFRNVDDRKKNLELTRQKIGQSIRELMKDEVKNKGEIEKLKSQSKVIKQNLNNLKEHYYSLEEKTMLLFLNLPNDLHDKTPSELVVCHKFLENENGKSAPHWEIAQRNDLVEYTDPFTFYFKSDAALFEMALLNYFRHKLLDLNYTLFSNPNFCRSVIVEGCGVDCDEKSKILMVEQPDCSKDEVNSLHLCGSASIYSFMAYFSRHFVQTTYFPLKYFSIGKTYHAINKEAQRDLFNLSQASVVSIFTATLEEDDLLEEISKQVVALYEPLGYHFRLAYLPAKDLDKAESLRLSIQMYSNHLQDYVEVGNVSAYDSYLSKRLLFNYAVNKERKYPKIISGALLNVPKLFGCVLENNSFSNGDLLTPMLEKFVYY